MKDQIENAIYWILVGGLVLLLALGIEKCVNYFNI